MRILEIIDLEKSLELELISPEVAIKEFNYFGQKALEEADLRAATQAYMDANNQDALRDIAYICIRENNLYNARLIYEFLNDIESLRSLATKCLGGNTGYEYEALRAYIFLQDEEGIMDIIRSSHFLESAMEELIGTQIISLYDKKFKEWANEKNIDQAYAYSLSDTLHLAYHLANDYELGIPIAKGGLSLGYMFNLFGLEIRIVQAHRKGVGATFKKVDLLKEQDLDSKRIAIFDKDVVSGRTTKRVLREIQQYNPLSIDLILLNNPTDPEEIGFGTHKENIPQGYNKIFYPSKFSYDNFDKAVKKLKSKLK